jgi:hypothetical protein
LSNWKLRLVNNYAEGEHLIKQYIDKGYWVTPFVQVIDGNLYVRVYINEEK